MYSHNIIILFNVNEDTLRNRIIRIYGYNGYLRCLLYIADIAELSKIANTNAYSPYFLSTLKKRAYVSSLLPKGNEGYVLEDIDLVLVRWSADDRLGKFKLLEFKENQHYLDKAQTLTFGLIDRMLKSSDEAYRYEGYYLINIVDNKDSNNNNNNYTVFINNINVSIEEFKAFLLGKIKVEPYRFELEYYL